MQTPEHNLGSGRQDPGIRGLKPKPQPVQARQDTLLSCSCPPGHPHPTQFPWHLPTPKGNYREALVARNGGTGPEYLAPHLLCPCPSRATSKLQGTTCSKVPSTLRQAPGHREDGILDWLNASGPLLTGLLSWCSLPILPSTRVKPSARPYHPVQIHCFHSPAPMGSSRGPLSHVAHIVGFRESPPALLIPCFGQGMEYGKSLVNALKIPQDIEEGWPMVNIHWGLALVPSDSGGRAVITVNCKRICRGVNMKGRSSKTDLFLPRA